MKAIVINPTNKTIEQVELPAPTLDFMQAAVGGSICFAHRINEKNDLFVDDEGLFKANNDFFFYEGAHQPFAGNGVIVGCDHDGETIGSTVSLEKVKKSVTFLTRSEAKERARQLGL